MVSDSATCCTLQWFPTAKHCSLVNVGMCEICEMEDEADDLVPQGKVDM